jgi:predicted acylesterase/phospholipase RssA
MSATPGSESDRAPKLGLALAGGGFRAALFHIGVLRRLAEFDLLRYVDVLSTVSGGSVVGALYMKELDSAVGTDPTHARLSQNAFIDIVSHVERVLRRGIRSDIRTKLLMNPFRVLWMLVSWSGLSVQLARSFDRHFFGLPFLRSRSASFKLCRLPPPASIDLNLIRHELAQHSDNAQYPAAIPKLVLNATCLNSGERFWFSRSEVGDWRLGHFRTEDLSEIKRRRVLWDSPEDALFQQISDASRSDGAINSGAQFTVDELWMAGWLREGRANMTRRRTSGNSEMAKLVPEKWRPYCHDILRTLTEFGYLRQAEIFAKQLRVSINDDHLRGRLRETLNHIDEDVAAALTREARSVDACDFICELYLSYSASHASENLAHDLETTTLAEAVAASANFPPVFPPMKLFRFFDSAYITRLGLTDGGVFENSGVQALLDEDCDYLIISDPGSPFGPRRRSSTGRFWMMSRIAQTLMEGTSWRQKVHIRALDAAHRITAWAWIDVDGNRWQPEGKGKPSPLETGLDSHGLARLRTDLDHFGDAEIAMLITHGYDRADRCLRRFFEKAESEYPTVDFSRGPRAPVRLPECSRIDGILKVGRSRFGRPAPAWAWTWVGIVGAAALLGLMFVAPSNDWYALATRVEQALWAVGVYPRGYTGGKWIALVVSLFILTQWAARQTHDRLATNHRRWARWVFVTADGLRGLSFNILWMFGLLPVWIALATAATAALYYVTFGLLERRMTRMRGGVRIQEVRDAERPGSRL